MRSTIGEAGSQDGQAAGGAVYRGAAIVGITLLSALSLGVSPGDADAQDPEGSRNLHVLPDDIPRAELIDIMLENQAALGLPRRANEGCLFCHVGSMDVPSREWDWSSDENPRKATARAMMAMVEDINANYLGRIERTTAQTVTCYTCHAGRTNPLPLVDVLRNSYAEGGVDALVDRYRTLRARYYAADAYDFRTATLVSVADELYAEGRVDDARRVHETNIESTEDPAAHQGLIRMRLLHALESTGVDAMVDTYHALKSDHPVEAFAPGLLSSISWPLFRSGSEEPAVRLWELNFEEHPESYVATEDLAWGRESTGDHDGAIALAEAWVAGNPEHELGLRLLADLRDRGR